MTTAPETPLRPEEGAILTVDDEDDIRESIAYFLKKKGFEVLEAKNGTEAFNLLEKRSKDLGFAGVQAVLSDWMMPGSTGLDLLKAMRGGNHSNLPFVLISGAVTQEQLLDVLRTGADAVLLKPFNMDSLLQKIQEAIATRSKRELANLMKT